MVEDQDSEILGIDFKQNILLLWSSEGLLIYK